MTPLHPALVALDGAAAALAAAATDLTLVVALAPTQALALDAAVLAKALEAELEVLETVAIRHGAPED